MRGKLLVWSYLLVLSFATILNLYMPKTEAAEKESIVIPGEAIRLRILANSDFEKDQAIKRKVRDAVNAQITLWVQDLTSMEKAREVLNAKLPEIQSIAEKTVREQGSGQSVKVEFGEVQFPTKLYGQFLYPAGKYQAILITLGEGEGANWWCVLYPPLCFLDFSNGVAVSEGFDEKKGAKKNTAEAAKAETQQEIAKFDEETLQPQQEAKEKAQQQPVAAEKPEKQQVAKKAVEQNKKPSQKKQQAKSSEKTSSKTSQDIKKQKALFEEETAAVEAVDTKLAAAEKKPSKREAEKDPVYVSEDEQPVEVKFFVVEMWEKMFN